MTCRFLFFLLNKFQGSPCNAGHECSRLSLYVCLSVSLSQIRNLRISTIRSAPLLGPSLAHYFMIARHFSNCHNI